MKTKKQFQLTAFFLALVISLSAFSGCAGKFKNEGLGESGSDSSIATDGDYIDDDYLEEDLDGEPGKYTPTVDQSKFPDGAFPIFDGSAYTIKVVVSDTASATERQIATKLRSELKKKTKTTISQSTDYLKKNESYDSSAYEILVGKTNHIESDSVYRSIDYNNYGIKTIGNKIVFHFATIDEGTELVSLFINALKSNEQKAFWIKNSIFVSEITSPVLTGLPKYPDSYTTTDCGDNTSMVVAKSTSLSNFNKYCETLTSNGYTEYSKRENIDGNYFRTYTKGSTAVTAYFSNGRGQARIIVGPIKDIPSKDKDETPETVKPSVTMIGPSDNVSGSLTMIYQLANGKFIIIDGGIILADRIYKELKELQPNATKYTIAGWFISHPHSDHQDGIEYFIEQHVHEVNIENIYFNYAKSSYYDNPSDKDHTNEREGARATNLREILETKVSRSTRIVKPHSGQIYNFGSATVEVISTVEDLLPTQMPYVNDTSMVLRITVAGQSTMLLGDASKNMKNIIRSMYDSHVKSDMVTLAHHGVWDFNPELYNEIKAKVLFWPNNTAGAKEFYNKSSSTEAKKSIDAALKHATDVFLAKGTDTKLLLPYTPVGNKSSFINNTFNK